MKKLNKKIIASILIVLVFFSAFTPISNANFFTDDEDEDEEDTSIEETIDADDRSEYLRK